MFPSKKQWARWPNSGVPVRCGTSGYQRLRRKPFAAPTKCIPSLRCKPSIPCGRGIPRTRSCPQRANLASASWLTPRLAEDFSPDKSRRFEDFAPDDYRRNSPRFQGENFQKNLDLVRRVEVIAKEKKCTPGQLALAWLLAQGED